MNLALFDFDGTITNKGTYLEFIRFAVSLPRQLVGNALLSPLIAAYHLGLISAQRIRPAIAHTAFRGASAERLSQLGAEFSSSVIPPLVRSEAQSRIDWHKQRGDEVVVVSASLDVYMSSWCQKNELSLICTRLEVKDGKATGRYLDGDCTGAEKKRRILERYDIAQCPLVYAYGDTAEDDEMLSLAQRRVFCWQELTP